MAFPPNIVCCERQDETKYLSKCGCPRMFIGATGEAKTIRLCGYAEFVRSTPPKKYLRVSMSASASNSSSAGDCDASTGPYPFSESGSDSAVQFFKTDPTCMQDLDNQSWSRNGSTTTCTRSDSNSETLTDFSFPYGSQSLGAGSGGGIGLISAASITSESSTVRRRNASYTGGSQTHTVTLSNEDTELTAEARTEASVITPTYSHPSQIWQQRTTGFELIKRELQWFAVMYNLQAERTYNYQIGLSSRGAVIGTLGTWTSETPITGTFTATKEFYLLNGTLNSNITDQDFIENNYSLRPSRYGLSDDDEVVSMSGTLPFVQGTEQALEDNTDTNESYVELS